ncbi:MAG: hypothetical protein CVV44_16605 [Spirochaetae bacterium HGW-Spirochaetae-1]|jgi:hypothetical protein|nr:MAG: hypothetical protein CVV44_16605 [Spirochaetae bacterium HGW-Spirochaetae-1]
MNTLLIIILFLIIVILIWALFGGEKEADTTGRGSTATPPEQMFRKRAADREIEEEFPEDAFKHRRKSDRQTVPNVNEPDETFRLPYLADDIISDSSRLRVYKRTLINSEIYAGKGDFTTAISLYEGVHARTRDTDVRFKIDADIEYLRNYKVKKEKDNRRMDREKMLQEHGKKQEFRFTLDGPQTLNIGVLDPKEKITADQIAQKVSEQLKQELASEQKEEMKKIRESIELFKDENSRRLKELEQLQKGEVGDDSSRIKKEIDELNALKDNLNKLGDRLNDGLSKIPETDRNRLLSEARFDKPFDPKPIMDLLSKIPDKDDMEKALSKERGVESPQGKGAPDESRSLEEKKEIKEKYSEDDEEELELLQDVVHPKDQDQLTDEEIFEKLIRENRDKSIEDDIEILGEKKEDISEFDILNKDTKNERREDERFYRNLLATEKRYKKELPILKVSYDFNKLPDEVSLSREKNLMEYSFYKYKPMLEKAHEFIQKRQVRDAINYYKVVLGQNIPPEFKAMIRRNISDLTEYLEKYLTGD